MMDRRGFLVGTAASLSALFWATSSLGGTYLYRASVLVDGADRESSLLRRRLFDKELARVLHRVALSRVEAASRMSVPPEVAKAHPHCLLVLEAFERAADAAVRGDNEGFLMAQARARAELVTLVSVLKELGWELPKLK